MENRPVLYLVLISVILIIATALLILVMEFSGMDFLLLDDNLPVPLSSQANLCGFEIPQQLPTGPNDTERLGKVWRIA
jgi:hypothetical protein